MAIVLSGYEVTVSVRDNGGQASTLRYELSAVDMTEAETTANDIIAFLLGVTDSVVASYRVSAVREENALVLPPAGVQNQNKASVTVNLANSAKRANLKIPAPKIDIFAGLTGAAADVVDATNGALLSYVGLYEAGGGVLISDGELVSTANPIDGGKRIHAKSNRG